MASILTDLAAGHVFEPFTFTADAARVRAYLAATGDTLAAYEGEGFVPPLAVAAFALGMPLSKWINRMPTDVDGRSPARVQA